MHCDLSICHVRPCTARQHYEAAGALAELEVAKRYGIDVVECAASGVFKFTSYSKPIGTKTLAALPREALRVRQRHGVHVQVLYVYSVTTVCITCLN